MRVKTARVLRNPPVRAESRCTELVLVGPGAIGRELLTQLASRRCAVPGLRVRGVVDRTGYVLETNGLTPQALSELCDHKAKGRPLHSLTGGWRADPLDAVAFIAAHCRGPSVLIDTTAGDTRAMLELVLERGWDVVLANKLPIADEQAAVDRLHALGRQGGGSILHEATVGAGLPVIDTLRKLIEAGDRVHAVEGCPSGTLGFLFGELGRGNTFSAALRSAIDAGYTEPDPRVDLSGLDVARKALILGRMIGFRGDLPAVRVESLVPPALRGIPVAEFLGRAHELDDAWEARVDAARRQGAVLRYRVRVTSRSVRAGLARVSADDPLSQLSGTDNQFSFTTARYRPQPLVIRGPGAGHAVTAAGVYGDLRQLATTWRGVGF